MHKHEKLKRLGFSRVYYSSYKSGHRRGVAILISHRVPFKHLTEIKDKEGRYLFYYLLFYLFFTYLRLILGKIYDAQISLLNVYAPPGSDYSFNRKIFDVMMEATGILICGGDWNIRLNPRYDSSKQSTQTLLHRKI